MAKRSNGEGSSGWVEKNGRKYYRIRVTTGYNLVTGKQQRKDIYGKTQKEAKQKLKDFLSKKSSHTDNSTLGNFMYDWLWNIKKPSLKSSTFERWEGIYRLYIKPTKGLNDKKIIDIDTMYLQKITNEMLKTHTVRQIKNMNSCIGTCLQYAVALHKIMYNPTDGIIYPHNNEVQEEKNNYISEDEQKLLIKALKGDEQEGIILIGLTCGMRLGEAMTLTEKDIDFNTRMIKINKSVKYVWTGRWDSNNKKIYEYQVTIPKTKSSIREVPFSTMLIPILKSIIRTNKENKLKYGQLYYNAGLIFCTEYGYYIDSKKPNRHLKAALKRAHIDADIHYHSLRHIFITNYLSHDVNPKTVMEWAGHSDIKMTMMVYAELNRDKNKKEYDKINDMFE